MSIRTRWQAASRRQRIALILATLWLLYALLGYLLLSPWLRGALVSTLSELAGREVTVEKVVFNPLALSLSVQGFALKDDDGGTLFGFEEFYANFQLSSLFRWSWHFDEISLFAPVGRVVHTGNRSFNFDDIVARLTAENDDAPVEKNASPAILPRVSFRELLLVQGDFRFRDEDREQPEELVLAPVSFQILDFSTRADGQGNNVFEFAVSGPAGGRLDWAGSVAFDPLVADGRLSLTKVDLSPFADFFQHHFAFRVPSAMLDIASDYRVEAYPDGRLSLSQGGVTLANLVIRDPLIDDAVLRLPLLEIKGVEIDTVAQQVGIKEMLLQGLELDLRLRNDGLHLEQLFAPQDSDAPDVSENNEAASAEKAGLTASVAVNDTSDEGESDKGERLWRVLLERLQIDEGSVRVVDESLAAPAMFTLSSINVLVEQVAFNRDEQFSLTGDITLAETGRIELVGEGRIEPLSVTLRSKISRLPLSALQGWVADSAAVNLSAGELAATLLVEHAAPELHPESVDTRVSGQVIISGLNLLESNGNPLLEFSALTLDGIALSVLESQLDIGEVTLADLRVQSLVDASGNDLSVRIAVPTTGQSDSSSEVASGAAPWALSVGKVQLRNGELVHIDRSMLPAFRVGLYRLDGDIHGLSSDPARQADINLTARLDQVSPFSVRGKIAPLTEPPQMDLTVSISGYAMNGLTPYTGQYLGYAVESGQLAVESRIAIDGSMLDSDTGIRADNFFLGDSVPSDEALNVPIKLGLAVLRDRNGLIELPVKARGDLNDPSVSVSGIILRALTNIMVRAATSPFSALAALAGGEELDHIDFMAGAEEPSEDGRRQMAVVAQLLGERPTLLMNLSGSAHQHDRLPLASDLVGRELMADQWSDVFTALDERRFRRAVQSRYREQHGQSVETLLTEAAPEGRDERDRWLSVRAFEELASQRAGELPDTMLNELASARARHVRTLLVDEFGLDSERLFIVAATLNTPASLSGVMLSLGSR